MDSKQHQSRENRYNGRPEQQRFYNRPAPLPEGFALYYIAANCPPNINERIATYKQYMQQTYGCVAAQKSPAHITIVPPFKAEEEIEQQLADFVEAYNVGLVPFDIQLHGFDHFDEKVLFVNVASNDALMGLEQELNQQFAATFPTIIFRTKPEFHPHVTIATRDMPINACNEVLSHFRQQEIDESFSCKALTVMKLTRGLWQPI